MPTSGSPAAPTRCTALRRAAPPRIGLVRVDSLIDADAGAASQHAPSWLPRLLPRGVRYAGRVHEQPLSALPRRRLDVQVAHDGYLPRRWRGKRGPQPSSCCGWRCGRTAGRCLSALSTGQGPRGARRYAAGRSRSTQRAHAGADAGAGWRHDLVLRRLFTLKKLARFEAAMALAEAEMPHWGDSPDFFFTLGDLLLDWAAAQPQHARRRCCR